MSFCLFSLGKVLNKLWLLTVQLLPVCLNTNSGTLMFLSSVTACNSMPEITRQQFITLTWCNIYITCDALLKPLSAIFGPNPKHRNLCGKFINYWILELFIIQRTCERMWDKQQLWTTGYTVMFLCHYCPPLNLSVSYFAKSSYHVCVSFAALFVCTLIYTWKQRGGI